MNEDLDLKFTRDYILYRPRQQAVYPIQELDWKRLRRMVSSIAPLNRIWQNLGSACLGLFFSAILSLVGFLIVSNLPAKDGRN